MDKAEIKCLQEFKNEICNDVCFETVLPSLIQASLLNREDVQIIMTKSSDAQRMAMVLELLKSKGQNAFICFINALQDDYGWLAERLNTARPSRSTPCDNVTTGISSRSPTGIMDKKLTPEMISMVGKNYRVSQQWTTLAHSLNLENHISPIRIKTFVFQENINLSVTYLLKEWMSECPKEANLGKLIYALRDNGFNDIADDLEEKFSME